MVMFRWFVVFFEWLPHVLGWLIFGQLQVGVNRNIDCRALPLRVYAFRSVCNGGWRSIKRVPSNPARPMPRVAPVTPMSHSQGLKV